MVDRHETPDHTGSTGTPDEEGTEAVDSAVTDPADLPAESLSNADREILDAAAAAAEQDLVAEYRDRAARAEAELVNFRARVERDRMVNRDATVAEVLRSVLPAFDDLDRAEANGDIVEGSALELVVHKLRAGFERYGLQRVGVTGEPFDPAIHEALMQLEVPGAEGQTVHEVIQPGYLIGERVVRAAKVAVAVPKQD